MIKLDSALPSAWGSGDWTCGARHVAVERLVLVVRGPSAVGHGYNAESPVRVRGELGAPLLLLLGCEAVPAYPV